MRASVDDLIRFVKKHAAAVNGEDREQLLDVVERLRPWSARLEGAASDGAAATQLPYGELLEGLQAISDAGTVALQVLGARLARPEPWGGPFEDERDETENDG